MPISTVSSGQPVKASTINAVIAQANKVPDTFTAGANVAWRHGGSSTDANAYTKLLEVRIPGGGALRVVFSLRVDNIGSTGYGRIYRNGAAVGTQRGTSSATAVQYSEDLSGWAAGDLLQIYGYNNSGYFAIVSAVSIQIGESPIEFVTTI